MFIDKTENSGTKVRSHLRANGSLHANGSRRDTLNVAEVAVHRERRIPS